MRARVTFEAGSGPWYYCPMLKREFTIAEARAVGSVLGIDWAAVDPEQFRAGLAIELEHGGVDPTTNVTNDDLVLTAKIALAHLNEYPDYYSRLQKLEEEAEVFWKDGRTEPKTPTVEEEL
jgi:hypothetical protein